MNYQFIYDGEVTTYESFILLLLYGVYILIMNFNVKLRDYVHNQWIQFGKRSGDEFQTLKANSGGVVYHSFKGRLKFTPF